MQITARTAEQKWKEKTMRLIDADALLERMKKDPLFPLVERYGVSGVIDAEPTVDAVEVVRCKDCKHWERDVIFKDGWCRGERQYEDDFCSHGERREDGEAN